MTDYRDIAQTAISENRLKLSRREARNRSTHSETLFLLSAIPVIISFIVGWMWFLSIQAVVFLFLAILVLKLQKRTLTFKPIVTNLSREQQNSYLQWVVKEKLRWEIKEANEWLIIAQTPPSAGKIYPENG